MEGSSNSSYTIMSHFKSMDCTLGVGFACPLPSELTRIHTRSGEILQVGYRDLISLLQLVGLRCLGEVMISSRRLKVKAESPFCCACSHMLST